MSVHEDREIAQWILKQGWLDRETLQNYIEEAKARPDQTLCHLLVEDGVLSAEQALQATEEALLAARAAPAPPTPHAPHAGHAPRPAHPHAHHRAPAHGAREQEDEGGRGAWTHRRPRPAWVLPACIGGGLAVVVIGGILLLGGGPKKPQDVAKAPEAGAPASKPGPAAAPAPPRTEPGTAKPAEAEPATSGPPSPSLSREEEAAAALARIRPEGRLSDRLTMLRELCDKYPGTRAAGDATAAIEEIEKRAGEAWQEKQKLIRGQEARKEFGDAVDACLEFAEGHADTKASEAAREERRRILQVVEEEWRKIEPRFKDAIEGKRYDEVKALVAEVGKWRDSSCNRRAEELRREALRRQASDPDEVATAPPPEKEEPGGEIAKAPESEPKEEPKEEPKPETPETPERKGAKKADAEGVAKKLGVTVDELKSLFATEQVSLEGDYVVLTYEFGQGMGSSGEINRELGKDFVPQVSNRRTDPARWSEPWEGSITKVFYGVRVSETGRLEHKARWLPDVEVSIQYLPAGQYRAGTFFGIGFHSDAEPDKWVASNHGVQACLIRSAKRLTQAGAIRAARPTSVQLPEVNREYKMSMKLSGKTCAASLGERKGVEISEDDEIKKGRVGFIWWGSVVGTIGEATIKGKLDPDWVREALGKKKA